MALFRKFFLKKTPDRLLEISERVYGIMPSSLGGAGPGGARFAGESLVPRRIFGFGAVWGSDFGKVLLSGG